MQKALILVVAVGVGIGLALPSGQSQPDAPPAEGGKPPVTPAAAAAAPAPASGWATGEETRLRQLENGHFYTPALVNGHSVEFVVDTGASSVALTVEDARRIGVPVDPATFDVIGTGASGPVRGAHLVLDSVDVDGKRVEQVRGAVLEGLQQSLLGQSYLSRIGSVSMSGGTMTLR